MSEPSGAETASRATRGARTVVVTGTGAVTSLGVGARQLTDRWIAGESGIVDGFSRCLDFSPEDFMTRKEVRRADRFAQLAVAATQEALGEAGWTGSCPYPAERVGCIVGTTVGGLRTEEEQIATLRDRGPSAISALTIPMVMSNSAAGGLALRHQWRGPSFSVSSACASGGQALAVALRTIQAGDADAVVTGASEAVLTETGIAAFQAMEALSTSGQSLPFDARRDGFVMGEGAGVMVLEAAETAAARGATVLGEVLGFGSTGDGYHITAPDPEARGATAAIIRAMEDAGVTPAEIHYVNAHGTATVLNDRAETVALNAALGPAARDVPISSTKSAIGHLLGAAGIVEAVATVHALRKRTIPPTVGYAEQDEGLDLDYVPVSRPLDAGDRVSSVALSNAFGFGGHNVVVCLKALHA
jgi:3-oxoacyl-[acyl-carrier-protein] synthase II